VGGRITALHFQSGQKVRAGQPLVQLNDAPERGDLQRLQAQAKLARINLERAKKLLSLAVSQSELDTKQAELDGIEADTVKTQALIAQKLIRAPFTGQLGVRQVHLGQFVNPGDPVVTLTDLGKLYVNLTLPEQTSGQLAVGQTVNVSVDAQAQRSFAAKVIAIEPQIGVDTRSIKLQAELDNKDNLLAPGMFAHASLQLPVQPNVLTVPETAVDYTIHGDSVFVVHKSAGQDQQPTLTATRALVKTGARVGDRVVITDGLKPGDLVVTVGQLKLQDGAPVALVDNKTLRDAAAKQGSNPQ
jgi:multidrug efflux system membrane fusion protein